MRIRSLILPLLLAPTAFAQDMIGVTWSGDVRAIDSFTGTSTLLGSGQFGQNALARDGNGHLWSTRRTGSPWQYDLTQIDPTTGAATVVWPNVPDLRGLAAAGGTLLYVAQEDPGSGPDLLSIVDTATGVFTSIGPTGFGSLQSLANCQGVLYAWDLGSGLITIDPATGAGTVVNPGLPPAASIQWLACRADGQLVGGNDDLFVLDRVTGAATLVGPTPFDVRGAEPFQQFVRNFGTGCSGALGQVGLQATIASGASPVLTLQSTNHQANAIGLLLVGISSQDYGTIPLPLLLDPLFGTQGCNLYTSPDVSVVALAGATSPATLDFAVPILPDWPGNVLYAQHLTLENVPGGLALSNAVMVQFGW